jgi:tRNA pseudouridine55 synthase
LDGFLCVNKPQGPSSFKIVAELRKALKVKKIGHAGTLDPEASGLLVIAVGSATRLIQYLPNEPKVYRFGLQFGFQTDTLDNKGTVIAEGGAFPSSAQLKAALNRFHGEHLQVPPAFSAKKINGVRAYEMARNGDTPDLKPCRVKIHSLDLIQYDQDRGIAELELCCSGGTYVRAIVRDLASALDTYGIASFIRRYRSGNFNLDQAMEIDDIDHAVNYIMPATVVLGKEPGIQLSEPHHQRLLHGMDISLPQMDVPTNRKIFAFSGTHLLAVLQWKQGSKFHPVAVFPLSGDSHEASIS